MYKYKIVKLGLKQSGLKGFVEFEIEDHNEIIDKHAEEGWKVVQILPIKYNTTNGAPMEFEIIFERGVDN